MHGAREAAGHAAPLGRARVSTPKRVIAAVDARDGRVCAWHGHSCDPETLSPQHRAGGMGGSRTKHRLSNVVWLDSITNGLIESDPELAREARARGIKISQHSDPSRVPVRFWDGLFFLDDNGGRFRVDETPF